MADYVDQNQNMKRKGIKHRNLYTEVLKINLIMILFLFFFVALIISSTTLGKISQLRFAPDTLDTFDVSNTLFLTPDEITLNYTDTETYIDNIVANEVGLTKKNGYRFSEETISSGYAGINDSLASVLNTGGDLNFIYKEKSDMLPNTYAMSADSRVLIEYFKLNYNLTDSDEINTAIYAHDYVAEPISIYVAMSLNGTVVDKEYQLTGITMDTGAMIYGNESIESFFTAIFPAYTLKLQGEDYNAVDPVIIKSSYISCNGNADTLANYLNNSYNDYVFVAEDSNSLFINDSKNVSNNVYYDTLDNFNNAIAYTLADDYFALRDNTYFRNNFSYTGNLDINDGEIIVSSGYLKHILNIYVDSENMLGNSITVDERNYLIKGVLDKSINDNIYFTETDYKAYIAPLFPKAVRLYVDDYNQISTYASDINSTSNGINASYTNFDSANNNIAIANLETARESFVKSIKAVISVLVVLTSLAFILFVYLLYVNHLRLRAFRLRKENLIGLRIKSILLTLIVMMISLTVLDFFSMITYETILRDALISKLLVFPSTSIRWTDLEGGFNYLTAIPIALIIIFFLIPYERMTDETKEDVE